MNIAELELLNPCRDGLDYARAHASLAEAWEKCTRPDWMLWLLDRRAPLTPLTAAKLACLFARGVLDICEANKPWDDRPRKAIEAAERWIAEPTQENAIAAAIAAAAASHAGYAAADSAACSALFSATAAAECATASRPATASTYATAAAIRASTYAIAAYTGAAARVAADSAAYSRRRPITAAACSAAAYYAARRSATIPFAARAAADAKQADQIRATVPNPFKP